MAIDWAELSYIVIGGLLIIVLLAIAAYFGEKDAD